MRALRHGLAVVEMAVTQMPGRPLSVMTLKGSLEDDLHKYMVVSFPESTIVLEIKQDKVQQVTNAGFYTNESTLHTNLLSGDVFIQVTPKSLIQIKGEGEKRKRNQWESDQGKIVMACSNERQVAIYIEGGLTGNKQGGQLVYFELEELTGLLAV